LTSCPSRWFAMRTSRVQRGRTVPELERTRRLRAERALKHLNHPEPQPSTWPRYLSHRTPAPVPRPEANPIDRQTQTDLRLGRSTRVRVSAALSPFTIHCPFRSISLPLSRNSVWSRNISPLNITRLARYYFASPSLGASPACVSVPSSRHRLSPSW